MREDLIKALIKLLDHLASSNLGNYLGLGLLLLFFKTVSWTKMLLGGFLSIVGAFFPTQDAKKKEQGGEALITANKLSIRIKGGIRFTVIAGGIIIMVAACFDGATGVINNNSSKVNVETDIVKQLESLPDDKGLIGIQISPMDSNQLLVTYITKKSSAETAGLKVGDVINKIDGLFTQNIPAKLAYQSFMGLPGTIVRLEVERKGEIKEIDIIRVKGSELAKLVKDERELP